MSRIRILVFSLLLSTLLGLLECAAAQAPAEIGFTVTEFQVAGDNPLGASATEAVLRPYTGSHSGLEGLRAASEALQNELDSRGYAFHRVVLPQQTLTGGVVRLQVVELELGKVNVENNRYFDDRNVLTSLPGLEEGRAPNVNRLSRALRIANAHPAKQLRITFNESDETQTIDATVRVDDRRPSSFFSVLQNTGTDETGDWRLSLGYQHSNLFDRDHSASVVYTTSPDDTDAVTQLGLIYAIPFYRVAGTLSFVYADSNVESGIVQDFFEVSGAGTVAGIHFTHTFRDRGVYRHEAEIGYEDKLFENDLTFIGQPLASIADVRSNPVSLTYRGRRVGLRTVFGFEVGGVSNRPNGGSSDAAAYGANRAGADPNWSAVRYAFEYSRRFDNAWALSLRFKGQSSGEPLVPGEQFGVGGAQSLRGFDERELLADNGWQTSLEMSAPPLGNSGIRLLYFYDLGHLEDEGGVGQSAQFDPASVGVGLRWLWRDQLSIAADAASVLEGAGNTEDGDTALHVSLFHRF